MMKGLNPFFFLCTICFSLFISSSLHAFASPASHLCRPDQRDALLELKHEFPIQKMDSWRNDTDCFLWDGVTYDAESGEVIELDLSSSLFGGPLKSNSSLFRLQYLQILNLSYNDFKFSPIPAEFNKLTRLTRLNLSHSSFSGRIPVELLELRKLVSLDLTFDRSTLSTEKTFLSKLARNLTNLRELYLSYVDISSIVPSNFVNLSSLRSLQIDRCNLIGEFPGGIFLMPNIQSLNFVDNSNLRGSLPEFHKNHSFIELAFGATSFSGNLPDSIGNLVSLDLLALAECDFSGTIPAALGNLSHLSFLDLAQNNFVGEIPSSFGNLNRLIDVAFDNNKLTGGFPLSLLNLTELSFLDLFSNNFTGLLPSNFTGFSKLATFYASGNSFIGALPSSLFTIPSLNYIDLGHNQLSGPLEFGNISSSPMLLDLDLQNNHISGSIPTSISKFVNLDSLDLSYLDINSTIDLSMFSNLVSLHSLSLSGIKVSTESISSTLDLPFSLEALYLSGCNIREFPHFLRSQKGLMYLDLSNNKIQGQVPEWLWRLPLTNLNLSHNFFSHFEGPLQIVHETKIDTLDLSSNMFQGPFPGPPQSIRYMFSSRNNFTGEIPHLICELSSLEIFDASNNNLSGPIPPCLGNSNDFLSDLNLRNNNFSGSLSKAFENASHLRSLDIVHNQFEGRLPKSLINSVLLEVLNVESNKIRDRFPFWLKALRELRVLVLRSNEFYGSIHRPHASVGFSKLHIIDISHNRFTGSLPPDYFFNWTAMSSIATNENSQGLYMGDGYYSDSVVLMNKGVEMKFVRILTILTAIDFSGNRLRGKIPESIGLLKELRVLNLSGNVFTGHIPPSMASLSQLESLDLSRNRLSGEIPPQLGDLSFLSYMNFSCNRLLGPIPQGTQFGGQPKSSFEDNLGLCGPPLSQSCGEANTPTSQQNDAPERDQEEILSWIAVVIGLAPGLLFGLTIGHIFTSYKHQWFTKALYN